MASKHMKGCSPSLAGREKQVKAMASYHFTPTKMARLKKTTGVGKDGEKREPSLTAGRNVKPCRHLGEQTFVTAKGYI